MAAPAAAPIVQAASKYFLKGVGALLKQPATFPALITGIALQRIIRSTLALYQGKEAKPLSMGQQAFVQLLSGALGYAAVAALGLGFTTGTAKLVAILAPLIFFFAGTLLTKEPTQNVADLQQANATLKYQLAQSQTTEPSEEAAKVQKLNDQIADLQKQLETAQNEAAEVQKLNDQIADLQKQLETAQNEAAEVQVLNDKITALTTQLETAQEEAAKVQVLNDKITALTTQLETAQEEAAKVQSLNDGIADLNAKLADAETEIKTLQAKLADAETEIDTLSAKLKDAETEVAELEKLHKLVNEYIDGIRAGAENRKKNLDALAQALEQLFPKDTK